MQLPEIEQRTAEWHKQRTGRVTGSRAGAALGLSPWQTADDVLRAMVREYHGAPSEFTGNPATNHGNMHERAAMLCFMRKTGLHVEDCGFFPYEDWCGASPDGLTEDGGVLELKVPFGCRDGKPFKTLAEQPHYEIQVQLEMLCSGRNHAYFAQYRAPKGDPFSPDYIPEGMLIERVELRDDLPLEELHAFYEQYLSELDNKNHLEPPRVIIDTDHAKHIINRMQEIDEALHNLTEEKKAHLETLVDMAEGKDALICGHKLTKTKDTTTVAYSKALKELAPNADLSKWTTVKQGYFRLS